MHFRNFHKCTPKPNVYIIYIKPYGLKIGSHSSSYACEGKRADTFRNKVKQEHWKRRRGKKKGKVAILKFCSLGVELFDCTFYN